MTGTVEARCAFSNGATKMRTDQTSRHDLPTLVEDDGWNITADGLRADRKIGNIAKIELDRFFGRIVIEVAEQPGESEQSAQTE